MWDDRCYSWTLFRELVNGTTIKNENVSEQIRSNVHENGKKKICWFY